MHLSPPEVLLSTLDAIRAELSLIRRAECARTLAVLALVALHALELLALALWLALR